VDFPFWERKEMESALPEHIEQSEKSPRTSSLPSDGNEKADEPHQFGGYA
jgi:hypothetical protein